MTPHDGYTVNANGLADVPPTGGGIDNADEICLGDGEKGARDNDRQLLLINKSRRQIDVIPKHNSFLDKPRASKSESDVLVADSGPAGRGFIQCWPRVALPVHHAFSI